MKTLIFEGIATSGKSTLIEKLQTELAAQYILLAGEPETHLPIMHQRDETHTEFFLTLIDTLVAKDPTILIFDRLYVTQASRAHCTLGEYRSVEDKLRPYVPMTIFLKVEEAAIESRIVKAAKHRNPQWTTYLRTKGRTPEEVAQTYIVQQQNQLELLKKSTIPFMVYDTTNHDYESILVSILQKTNLS